MSLYPEKFVLEVSRNSSAGLTKQARPSQNSLAEDTDSSEEEDEMPSIERRFITELMEVRSSLF